MRVELILIRFGFSFFFYLFTHNVVIQFQQKPDSKTEPQLSTANELVGAHQKIISNQKKKHKDFAFSGFV